MLRIKDTISGYRGRLVKPILATDGVGSDVVISPPPKRDKPDGTTEFLTEVDVVIGVDERDLDKKTGREELQLENGAIDNGNAVYKIKKRGILNSTNQNPPEAHENFALSHYAGDEVYISPTWLIRVLDDYFTATTTTESKILGEAIDSTSGNVGVSEYQDKYYKYSKFSKEITAVADNGSGKARFTSTAHGLADGTTIKLTGFAESAYNVVGVVSNATADTFDIETITYVSSDSGTASGFDNYQGVLLAGQTLASGDSFTLYNLKAIVSGFAGLGDSWVYVENGGGFTTTPSSTTTIAGIGRTNGTELVGAERVPPNQVLTEAQVTDPTSTVEGVVTGELLGEAISKASGSGKITVKALETFSSNIGHLLYYSDINDCVEVGSYIGYSSTAPLVAVLAFLNGTSFSTIDVGLFKKGSPTDNVTLRIETDDGNGFPSGTLVHPNATASIAGSSLTTSPTSCTFTLAGEVTVADLTKCHIVLGRSGAVDTSNYYRLASVEGIKTILVSYGDYGDWRKSYYTPSIVCDGVYTSGMFKHCGISIQSGISTYPLFGFVETATAGSDAELVYSGKVSGSFEAGAVYYIDTDGLSLVTSYDQTAILKAISSTEGIVGVFATD